MKNIYSMITDISLLGQNLSNEEEIKDLFKKNFFSDKKKFDSLLQENSSNNLSNYISSPLKKRMSQLSVGICASLEKGIKNNLTPDEEIFFFTSFAEIETTNKIINSIKVENSTLVSPTLFHNSVHNTPLGYFTIINKIHNYCATISDGVDTNKSFLDFLKYRLQLNKSFVVCSGEEHSGFYSLDKVNKKDIVPIYISYRITCNQNRGFRLLSIKDNISDLDLSSYNFVFSDLTTFDYLSEKSDNLYTDYILTKDNPCSIIFRLALPFIIGLSGKILIIERIKNDYYLIEAML